MPTYERLWNGQNEPSTPGKRRWPYGLIAVAALTITGIVAAMHLASSSIHTAQSHDNTYTGDREPLPQDRALESTLQLPNSSLPIIHGAWTGNSPQCYFDTVSGTRPCINVDLIATACPGAVVVGWEDGDCPIIDPSLQEPVHFVNAFCCPSNKSPKSCRWRGGNGPDCDGQCLPGEVALLQSSVGGNDFDPQPWERCSTGQKVLCCTSDHWSEVWSGCYWSGCNPVCDVPEKETRIINRWSPDCRTWNALCCTVPLKLQECHWRGEGTCTNDNWCLVDEVQIESSAYGGDFTPCLGNGKKALCCKAPPEDVLLPISADHIFPVLHDDYTYESELQFMDGKVPGSDPSTATALGWLVIAGPADRVSSLVSKADGSSSALRFLECNDKGETVQTRFVCDSSNPDEDCYHILDGGLEGKIIELPGDCGSERHAVAQTLEKSTDQALPTHLNGVKNSTIMAMTLTYDHTKIKRQLDPDDIQWVYHATNGPGYWDDVILKGHPVSRQDMNFRFKQWTSKRTDSDGELHQIPFNSGLISNSIPCKSGQAYAEIGITGTLDATILYGVSIYGRITGQDEVIIDQAYSVERTTVNLKTSLVSMVSGKLNVPKTEFSIIEEVLGHHFSPKLIPISVAPSYQLEGDYYGDADIVGNWTTSWDAQSQGAIVRGWPEGVIDPVGDVEQSRISGFNGYVAENFKAGRQEFNIRPKVGLQLSMHQGDKIMDAHQSTWYYANSLMSTTPDGKWVNTWSTTDPSSELDYVWDDIELPMAADNVTESGDSSVKSDTFSGISGSGNATAPSAKDITWSGTSLTNNAIPLVCSISDGVRTCDDQNTCPWNICAETEYCNDDDATYIEDDLIDDDPDDDIPVDDDGVPINEGSGNNTSPLTSVKNARKYTVLFGDGTEMVIRSRDYPSIGHLFETTNGQQVIDLVFDYASDTDCGNSDVVGRARTAADGDGEVVTEHILELQTISKFLVKITDPRTRYQWSSSDFRRTWLSNSLPANLPKVYGANRGSSRQPMVRIFEALGSKSFRENFVAADKVINSVKAKIWQGDAPRGKILFQTAIDSWLYACTPPEAFTAFIRATIAVFRYADGNTDVNTRLWRQHDAVRDQLLLIEANLEPNKWEGITDAWEEFFGVFITDMALTSQAWVRDAIKLVRDAILQSQTQGHRTPANLAQVERDLARFEGDLHYIKLDRH